MKNIFYFIVMLILGVSANGRWRNGKGKNLFPDLHLLMFNNTNPNYKNLQMIMATILSWVGEI